MARARREVVERQRERRLAELGRQEGLCGLVAPRDCADALHAPERGRGRRAERTLAVVDEDGVVVGRARGFARLVARGFVRLFAHGLRGTVDNGKNSVAHALRRPISANLFRTGQIVG